MLQPTARHGQIAAALVLALIAVPTHANAADAWPAEVHARYKLKFNGIDVGHIDFNSKSGAQTYQMGGHGNVSLLFGAIKWSGTSSVSGVVEGGAPKPRTYAFNWDKKGKGGAIAMKYAGGRATEVSVEPPAKTDGEYVPLKDEHKAGPVDPLTAVMMLTRADSRAPCERREAVFDGKHRYDIVFSYKRQARIPAAKAGGESTLGVVCRAMYVPIAGYKPNPTNQAAAANRDAEVTLRPVPGTKLMIPHSVTIPSSWGTGSMVAERIDVTTASAGRVALTE